MFSSPRELAKTFGSARSFLTAVPGTIAAFAGADAADRNDEAVASISVANNVAQTAANTNPRSFIFCCPLNWRVTHQNAFGRGRLSEAGLKPNSSKVSGGARSQQRQCFQTVLVAAPRPIKTGVL